MACLALRPMLDTAFFPYYLASVSATFLVLDFRRPGLPLFGAGWVAGLNVLSFLTRYGKGAAEVPYALAFFAAATGAFVTGLVTGLTRRRILRRRSSSAAGGTLRPAGRPG